VLEFLTALTNELNRISTIRFDLHAPQIGWYYPHIHLESYEGWGVVVFNTASKCLNNQLFDADSMRWLSVPKSQSDWFEYLEAPQRHDYPFQSLGNWMIKHPCTNEMQLDKELLTRALALFIATEIRSISPLACLVDGAEENP
jgi:hypothetical protein